MAMLQLFLVATAILVVVDSMPAPTVEHRAPVITKAAALPIQFNPTYFFGETTIDSIAYPLAGIGGNIQYSDTQGPNSVTVLGGLTLNLQYTQMSRKVYPQLAYTVVEADTESLVLNGLGTVIASELYPATEILILGTLGFDSQPMTVSGAAGIVTGGILGQPFSVIGIDTPLVSVPYTQGGTGILGDVATGLLGIGGLMGGGNIEETIATAASLTSLAGGASGSAGGFGLFGQATLGGEYVVKGTNTYASVCIGLGGEGIGYTECFGPTAPARVREVRQPAAVPAAPTPAATV